MTTVEDAIYFSLYLALTAAIAVGAWLSFRRTGARSFLFLGTVLILWPWFDGFADATYRHFVDQVMNGQRPWLFPFSLMVRGDRGYSGWEMPPGEFLTKFSLAKHFLLNLLLAVAFVCMAGSLKKIKEKAE